MPGVKVRETLWTTPGFTQVLFSPFENSQKKGGDILPAFTRSEQAVCLHTEQDKSPGFLWMTQEEKDLATIFKTSADWVEVALSVSYLVYKRLVL